MPAFIEVAGCRCCRLADKEAVGAVLCLQEVSHYEEGNGQLPL